MERLSSVTLIHAKDHPVLRDSVTWRLSQLRYSLSPRGETRVVLGLCREGEATRLRFDGVDEFFVASDFPGARVSGSPVRVKILDVAHLQWEGVSIRVESECGGLSFWAWSVQITEGMPAASRRRSRRV